MTDRELLEAAAKAAGYEVYVWGQNKFCRTDIDEYPRWSPLESNADAFRLMVDCHIRVWPQLNHADANDERFDATPCAVYTDHNNDKYAATRRAIVRAAAGE